MIKQTEHDIKKVFEIEKLKQNKNIEFEVKEVFDIEIEKEDREVGIFGNFFTVGFECKGKENVFLNFDDETFMLLLEKMKPYVLDEIAREENETERYKAYLEDKENQEKQEKMGKIITLLKFLKLSK